MNLKRKICKLLDVDEDGFITIKDIIKTIADVIAIMVVGMSVILLALIFVGLIISRSILGTSSRPSSDVILSNGIKGIIVIAFVSLFSITILYIFKKLENKVLYICPLKENIEQPKHTKGEENEI